MRITSGPYRGSELRITRPQPLPRQNPLRRVEIYVSVLNDWVPMYLYKQEIKSCTRKERS